MQDIVIVAAARTPVGSFNGALASVPAHDLGAIVVRALIERAGLQPDAIDEVILGQILTAAQGQNPARQAARNAGVPDAKTAFVINQVCGSGLRAVALAAQQVRTGESEIVVAGGMESMSLAPHAAYLRSGTKMGELSFTDTMLKDGLWTPFTATHGEHRGERRPRLPGDARGAGRLCRRLAAQGLGGEPVGTVPRRDRSGHGQGSARRHGGERGRVHPPRCRHGGDGASQARLQQGRLGHRRQRERHQ